MLRLLCASVFVAAAAGEWVAPAFCHGLNCPEFVVEKNMTFGNETVEIRQYVAGQKWTSTVVASTSLTEADQTGFNRLFDYIGGDNEAHTKVAMTCPVREYIQPGAGPNCNSNFTVSFYVPYEYQGALNASAAAPPRPSKADVYTAEDTTPLRVAVLAFSGPAPQDTIVAQVTALYTMLASTKLNFDPENWFFAAYDDPFRILDRHQEVWVQLLD